MSSARQISPRPAALGLAVILGLVACRGDETPASHAAVTSGARKSEAPRVLVAPVARREMVRYLETTTKIESEGEIAIHPESSGRVVSVLAEEGDLVLEGEVLCVLDSRDQELAVRDASVALEEARQSAKRPHLSLLEAEARLESARLAAEQAKRDHERDQHLFEESEVASTVSRQTVEGSRLAMETARSDQEQAMIAKRRAELDLEAAAVAVQRAEVALERAEFALAQRTITAPFGGVIAERRVRLGQSVGPADAVHVLTDPANIRVLFYRAQEELSLFNPRSTRGNGHSAPPVLTFEATTEAIPGVTFTGRVLRVSPTIDAESGQFRVTGVFDPGEEASLLLPGMLVRLRIATDRRGNALVVPKRAVRREGESAFLFVVGEDDAVRRVDVEEGYSDDHDVEVVPVGDAPLEEGMLVVSVGSRDLQEGDIVQVDEPRDEGDSSTGAPR